MKRRRTRMHVNVVASFVCPRWCRVQHFWPPEAAAHADYSISIHEKKRTKSLLPSPRAASAGEREVCKLVRSVRRHERSAHAHNKARRPTAKGLQNEMKAARVRDYDGDADGGFSSRHAAAAHKRGEPYTADEHCRVYIASRKKSHRCAGEWRAIIMWILCEINYNCEVSFCGSAVGARMGLSTSARSPANLDSLSSTRRPQAGSLLRTITPIKTSRRVIIV